MSDGVTLSSHCCEVRVRRRARCCRVRGMGASEGVCCCHVARRVRMNEKARVHCRCHPRHLVVALLLCRWRKKRKGRERNGPGGRL